MEAVKVGRALRFAIDDLLLDVGQCKLSRGGQEIRLTKLSFLLLQCLVEAAPNVLNHAELASTVWGPRRVVTPENLAKRIMLLRHALGDTAAHPRYIEAVRGFGYRMAAGIRPIEDTSAAGLPAPRTAESATRDSPRAAPAGLRDRVDATRSLRIAAVLSHAAARPPARHGIAIAAGVIATVLLVGAFASLLPALRAARVEPMRVLREE